MNLEEEKLLFRLIEKRKIYWEPLVAAGAILVAIFAVMVPLFIHSDNAARAQIEAIRQDIKDFHQELYKIKFESKK
jgi:hypothetical protein